MTPRAPIDTHVREQFMDNEINLLKRSRDVEVSTMGGEWVWLVSEWMDALCMTMTPSPVSEQTWRLNIMNNMY